MPSFSPISTDALTALIADRTAGCRLVAVDGADAAEPLALADAVAERVRPQRRCGVVSLHDFVRPASLRFEFGRTDELSYRTAWFDYAALQREVVEPMRAGGRFLPALWDERTDRSARAAVQEADVVIVAGPMLLGRGIDFDFSVHLHLSPAALQRRTPADQRWTIPALTEPDGPDVFVRWDHPDRPAVRR